MSEDPQVRAVLDKLRERGVTLRIGACGCCNSPWVKIAVDDVVIADTDGVSYYSIPDPEIDDMDDE